MRSARHRERLFRIDSYPKYIWYSFRESKFYQRTLYFWINFRRYRLISRIFTTLATILTIIGTGASVLIFAILCLLLLPLAALWAGGTMLLGFFRREHQNRKLTHEVSGRTVYLFFPDELDENFSSMTMRAFSHLPHSTVFVISPYSWSSKGLGGSGFYINARQEDEHLFLLRRHYFFFFRKLLNFQKDKQTVVIL